MKYTLASAIILIFLQSCASVSEQEMRQLVHLSPSNLAGFSQLRQQLLKDSVAINNQWCETNPWLSQSDWISTNSYYLNKIDSVKYATFFSKSKGKVVDDIMINKKGSVIFRIKQNTERHYDAYNKTYSHDIINADYEGSIEEVFSMVDTVFVDSTINKDWRYISYKVLTGH